MMATAVAAAGPNHPLLQEDTQQATAARLSFATFAPLFLV